MRRLVACGAALSTVVWGIDFPGAATTSTATATGSAPSGSSVRADFNRDGFADLAVGVPGENMHRGAVNVIYGSAHGLTAARNQIWSQDSPGIKGVAEARVDADGVDDGDRFGSALAIGDFDGDGCADLAVGVPGDNVFRGAVNVIYGSPRGLTAAGNQLWSQDSPGIKGVAEVGVTPSGGVFGEGFGYTLAAGDFDGNGHADLAVDVPGEDSHRGAVAVLYGSARGLTAAGDQLWTQDSPGIRGVAEKYGVFGFALVAADFGKGPQADLAVGTPFHSDGGVVNVLYGSTRGLTAAGNQLWNQDSPGIKGKAQQDYVSSDEFGMTLAAADFGKDPHADLAIGVPGEPSRPGQPSRGFGALAVLYGSTRGLTAAGDQLWSPNSPGIKSANLAGGFGSTALTAGDFGRSAQADLAASAGTVDGTEAVVVIYGSTRGLTAAGIQLWSPDSPGIKGEDGGYGEALAAGKFGKGPHADLAVGVPSANDSGGAVNVIHGSARGLTAAGNQLWSQDSPGIKGTVEFPDQFGGVLAARR